MKKKLTITIAPWVYERVMETKPERIGKSEHFSMYIIKGLMAEKRI